MAILRIHHAVPNFDGWKRAFDFDPMDRKGSGVRRYHVQRAVHLLGREDERCLRAAHVGQKADLLLLDANPSRRW